MVKHSDTANTTTTNASDQLECTRDSELKHVGGEFDWDRRQQAIVLAAYSYGRTFTAVRSVKT